jgi:uncharacterized protein YdaU (DUF1376 family)
MHWFTAYPDAWLSGTADLTTEESGAFWNLCCHYMAKDGCVPDDDAKLARIVKLGTRAWRRVKTVLLEHSHIEVRGGFIWQRKCEKQLKLAANFAQTQREKAAKRWALKSVKRLTENKTANAGADARADAPGDATTYLLTSSKEEGAVAPLPEQKTTFWDVGVSILTGAGKKESAARQIIGKWRRDLRDDTRLLALLLGAQKQSAVDPVSYVERSIRNTEARGGAGMC